MAFLACSPWLTPAAYKEASMKTTALTITGAGAGAASIVMSSLVATGWGLVAVAAMAFLLVLLSLIAGSANTRCAG
jgi:hypothetical protein